MTSIDDGASGGGDGTLPRPLAVDPFEDGSLETPNCPSCLTRMEAAEAPTGGVYWSCPTCGQTRLS
jgi:tRNA(Ile2) C34 agmatinyltransferase TiaS